MYPGVDFCFNRGFFPNLRDHECVPVSGFHFIESGVPSSSSSNFNSADECQHSERGQQREQQQQQQQQQTHEQNAVVDHGFGLNIISECPKSLKLSSHINQNKYVRPYGPIVRTE